MSSLKRNWSSIRYAMDNHLCCVSVDFLNYIRSRIFLFPHSCRNTGTRSNFQTLLDTFSKSSLSEILITLANHQSVSKFSSQWIPNFSVPYRVNQSDYGPQTDYIPRVDTEISYQNEMDGQVQLIPRPSHGSEARPLEISSLPEESEFHSSLSNKYFFTDHSKPAETESCDLLIEGKEAGVRGQRQRSANVPSVSVEYRHDQRVPVVDRYDDVKSNVVNTTISSERDRNNIHSATQSSYESVSKAIQISTPCRKVRTQTEFHSTIASVQTVEDRNVNRQYLYHSSDLSARSYKSIEFMDSCIQTEPPDECTAADTVLGKAEAVVEEHPIPVQSPDVHRIDDGQIRSYDHNPFSAQIVSNTDGSTRYYSLDDSVICKGAHHTVVPAISGATVHNKATQTRSMSKQMRTQTDSRSVTTAMQTVREDQLELERFLQPQLLPLELVTTKNIFSQPDEGKLHVNNKEDAFRSGDTKMESPSPAQRVQIERSNDDCSSMQKIVEDVQKSAQSIAAGIGLNLFIITYRTIFYYRGISS